MIGSEGSVIDRGSCDRAEVGSLVPPPTYPGKEGVKRDNLSRGISVAWDMGCFKDMDRQGTCS